jgi:8-oxo-dGTP diphosphatase
MKPVRVSAKAVIIRDDKLLVTVNRDTDDLFYLLPGGGQENGEALPAALRRECREELGVDIVVGRFLCLRDYIGANHEFAAIDGDVHQLELMFACELAPGEEPDLELDSDPMQTGATWLPLSRLESYRLFPLSLRPLLALGLDRLSDPYLGAVN